MNKLLIIGIDSLEPELLVKYRKNLPNFYKLIDESPKVKLNSIFPVDSIPAWVSIYTGLNPAKHGIVKTFDVFDHDSKDILNIDTSIFRGNAFWDYASNYGKKVCVLYPLLTYPPWKTNGIMVSRSIKESRVEGESEWVTQRKTRSFPSWVMEKYKIPESMRGISGGHPGIKNLKKWAEGAKNALIEEAELGLKICKNEEWDLFFIYLSWLDIIQHRLWRFSDKNDPSYPPRNPYENIIEEFHQIIDGIVGNYLSICKDATSIIFSDHGHGMRPTKVVNINKVLMEEGFLFTNSNKSNYFQYIKEKIKIGMLDLVRRFELDYYLVNLSTKTKILSTMSKNVYMSTSNLKKGQNIAYLSAFAGIKSYPHGGIEIEKKNINNGMDYEELRDEIIKMLLELKNPSNGERLIEWSCRREDLYQGPRISEAYPDIVFHLKEEYGTGWNMHTSLIGTAYDHNLASGGHKKDAVFLISNIKDKTLTTKNIVLMDIAPTVLDILGIHKEIIFDGKSIFKHN